MEQQPDGYHIQEYRLMLTYTVAACVHACRSLTVLPGPKTSLWLDTTDTEAETIGTLKHSTAPHTELFVPQLETPAAGL